MDRKTIAIELKLLNSLLLEHSVEVLKSNYLLSNLRQTYYHPLLVYH